MITAILPDTQARVDYVVAIIRSTSTKTGIPARKIFRPGRKAAAHAARRARIAVWRILRRNGWTFTAIAAAFSVSSENVSSSLKGTADS
jgi:hypothetical protein